MKANYNSKDVRKVIKSDPSKGKGKKTIMSLAEVEDMLDALHAPVFTLDDINNGQPYVNEVVGLKIKKSGNQYAVFSAYDAFIF